MELAPLVVGSIRSAISLGAPSVATPQMLIFAARIRIPVVAGLIAHIGAAPTASLDARLVIAKDLQLKLRQFEKD